MNGALHWTRLTTGPLLATGTASVITLVAHTLLLRSLPVDDAGLFALSMALIETLSLFGALGQSTLITRLYARQADEANDWIQDIARLILLASGPVILGVLILAPFYPLAGDSLVLVGLATLVTIPVNLSASMLNAKLHHTWGALLLRLPNSLLLVPAIFVGWSSAFHQLNFVLLAYLVGAGLILGLSLLLLTRHLPRGARRISLRQHVEGMIFVVSGGSQIMLNQGLVAIAGAMLQPAAVATFAAIAILLRPFRLLTSILAMIFGPQFIRHDRASYARPLAILTGLAGMAALAAIALTPYLAEAIYGSRYADGYRLIPWLALVGFLLVVRTVPSSHLAGRAPSAFINRVILTEATMITVVALASVLLIQRLGIVGLAIGLAVGHTAKTLTTFGFWSRFRRMDPFRGQPIKRW